MEKLAHFVLSLLSVDLMSFSSVAWIPSMETAWHCGSSRHLFWARSTYSVDISDDCLVSGSPIGVPFTSTLEPGEVMIPMRFAKQAFWSFLRLYGQHTVKGRITVKVSIMARTRIPKSIPRIIFFLLLLLFFFCLFFNNNKKKMSRSFSEFQQSVVRWYRSGSPGLLTYSERRKGS